MRILFILFLNSFAFGQGIPNDWLGAYRGTMEIYNHKGLQQTIGVEFDLQIMSIENYWSYNMSYIDLKNNNVVNTKSYKILYKEDSKTFWLDEGDSLLIEMSFLGNCFYDHFELSGMFFNSSLCKQDKNLLFEITGGQSAPSYVSPFIEEAEGSVQTMRIDFLQRVLLKPKQ